jgi:hypothetical protein
MRTDSHHETSKADRDICGEVRPTRLHYQLCCRLRCGHSGEHRWTPELLPVRIVV